MADGQIYKGKVIVKEEEEKSDEDSDSPPLSSLELVRVMYESIKDISSSTDSKEQRKMARHEKDLSDYLYEREDLAPDRSKTDYYCATCEAHMNSREMWESHISGKRHLKNVQKLPGEMPSKIRAIKIKTKAKLLDAIKAISDPVVGLQYMTELQRYDPGLKPSYTCHLCQANCTWSVVVDHILTTKHRLAYIKATDPQSYKMLANVGLKSTALDSMCEHLAQDYEEKRGCGEIEVKLEKPRLAPPPPKEEVEYEVSSPRSRSVSSDRTIKSRKSNHSRSSLRRHSYRSSPYKQYSDSSSEESSPRRHALSPRLKRVDFSKFSTSEKIDLMEKIVQEIRPIQLDDYIPGIITNLTAEILRFKVRQLPLSDQNKLAKYIARDEASRCHGQLIPLIEEIFDAANSGNLSHLH